MDTFLGRALTDPTTGLPNLPYFCLIQNWEERRARRRGTLVRVLQLHVLSGGDHARRSLMVRLCQDLRTSDLIASEGKEELRILLTTPDAEKAAAIAERIEQVVRDLNAPELAPVDEEPLDIRVEMEPPTELQETEGPCDPCEDEYRMPKDQSCGGDVTGYA